MLEFARKNRADPKIEYKSLDLMADDDVARFVKEEGQFDIVFSFLTLHWMPDQHHAFRNVAALMAPGGECFLVFTHTLVLFDIYVALMQSPRWKKYSEVSTDLNVLTFQRDKVGLLLPNSEKSGKIQRSEPKTTRSASRSIYPDKDTYKCLQIIFPF
ncbi:hypothetical protein HPB48_000979 [Haemaphysalis longicornis]|uniref:Methyltransferase type 11 domain-containing protein n=1 Tax=Haemaphysalis longicornis TaxID=44386 RepID=A0A9J6GWS3_HAELO|nr:hypothetical protein HPB48_000979 [Haemaphysalis longicornis]